MKTPVPEPKTFKLSSGRYWITDPGYAYPEDRWLDFCHGYSGEPTMAIESDHFFFIWPTAYGDGVYELRGPTSGLVGVDSGALSIIPSELVELWGTEEKLRQYSERGLTFAVYISSEFEVKEKSGDVKFGKYRLKTS